MSENQSSVEKFNSDLATRMESEVSYNPENYVAMANDMVKGTSNLNLYELKLLRTVIMQVKPGDTDFGLYRFNLKELANLLDIDSHNMYREIDKMTDHIMQEIIKIGDGNPKHKWTKFSWVSECSYADGIITIQLHQKLKPYIVGLQSWYTQYRLEDIVRYKSVYTIRMYELLVMGLKGVKVYADKTASVYIDITTIRRATNTEDKYDKISQFKDRVVYSAISEINEKSSYHIGIRDYKEGRSIVGFYFDIESQALTRLKEAEASYIQSLEPEPEQMTLDDFVRFDQEKAY